MGERAAPPSGPSGHLPLTALRAGGGSPAIDLPAAPARNAVFQTTKDTRSWSRSALSCFSCLSWCLLSACAPKPQAPAPQAVALDCSLPFETLAARITAQPGLSPAPKDPAEPYRFYSSADGAASWLITEPGAPGHPAIMMQRALHGDVKTTGCAYGDAAGYAQLKAYLEGLKTWHR